MKQKLDVMVIEAGTVIHFQGVPVYLAENTRVMGCRDNFKMEGRFSPFIHSAADKDRVTSG